MLTPSLALLSQLLPAYAQAPDARFALALYCNPSCDDAVFDALEAGLANIPAVDGFEAQVRGPGRLMGLADTTAGPYGDDAGFVAPDLSFVETYGVGVGDAEALTRSEVVILAWFSAPAAEARNTFATAHAAFAKAAEVSGGWVEDLDTQSVYGMEAWSRRDPQGAITEWFVVEPTGEETLRLVTRGLRRFGGQELVMEDVPAKAVGDASFVLNAVAVALHNGANVTGFELSTDEARGTVTLSAATAEADDPEPPLLAVRFSGQVLVDATLGAVASVGVGVASAEQRAPEPSNLLEARERVASRLQGYVRGAYVAGLGAGKLAIKVGYPTGTGANEYLWIEVDRWTGAELEGVVVSAPSRTTAVVQGARVVVQQADVYDYVLKLADGSKEGNFTATFVR